MYNFFKRINSLKRIPRMGWLESGASPSDTEDVAQHSFETSTMTMILADSVKKEINEEKALKMAILHDWAESVTGDFSKEATEQIGKEVKVDLEESVMRNILVKDLPQHKEYMKIWEEYLNSETKESKLVHLSDRLSILIEAKYQFRRGIQSKKIKEIWKSVRKEIEGYTEEFPITEEILEQIGTNIEEK